MQILCGAKWGCCMARTALAKVPSDAGLISAELAFVQAANEEERAHALSLMGQQARAFVCSIISVSMTNAWSSSMLTTKGSLDRHKHA